MSSRGGQAILGDLCSYDDAVKSSSFRLPHDCYMIYIGRLNKEYFQKLVGKVREQIDSDNVKTTHVTKFTMMETEEAECFLEFAVFDHPEAVEGLNNDRHHRFVYEDHFNPALLQMMKERASFERLKNVCHFYEAKKKDVKIKKIMEEHENRTRKSTPYFLDKGLSEDDAQGAAFALSFYTGTKSETLNRGASLVARQANGEVLEEKTKEEMNEAAIILYYLVKALSYIPYYWGYVIRSCQLTDDELKIYMPGSLITWIQFSSSKKGKTVAEGFDFSRRNTYFQIYSVTGRPIQQFSNFPLEDEVLFLPHSTFFVFKHEVGFHGTQHTIYMRQVELGLSEWSVLWVDDKIYKESWENKRHMESAATRAMNLNVHFIPKASTESALAFLRSPFGKRLKNKETFRIVTDMNRENERPVHNAGARLIKAIRKMGFKNDCLVFTSDRRKAQQLIDSELNRSDNYLIQVSDRAEDLRSFVNFGQSPESVQQSTHSENAASSYQATSNDPYGHQSTNYDDINNGMMHSRMNTNLDILIKNCQTRNLANERNNCVLLTTGSFNPVHPLHFQDLVRVKNYLENEHQPRLNVLAGYISPTHDSYVRHKLGDPSWIPAKDRCRLCEEAIKSEDFSVSSWISISRGESESSEGFVDFPEVTARFRDFLNSTLVDQERILKHPLRVVYVCGLDHYNKCSDVKRMAKQSNMASAVVYRTGYDDQEISRSYQTSGVIYVPLAKERAQVPDVSSTRIRNYYENPGTGTSGIERYIYPHVHDYMSKKYKKQ